MKPFQKEQCSENHNEKPETKAKGLPRTPVFQFNLALPFLRALVYLVSCCLHFLAADLPTTESGKSTTESENPSLY